MNSKLNKEPNHQQRLWSHTAIACYLRRTYNYRDLAKMPAPISKVFPAILLNQASGRTIEAGDHLATSLNIAIYGTRVTELIYGR